METRLQRTTKNAPVRSVTITLWTALMMPPFEGDLFPRPESVRADAPLASQAVPDPYWAYRPVERFAPPPLNDPWIQSPIDAFVLEKLCTAGLAPSPRADLRTLVRRAHFDLTGLPPEFGAFKSCAESNAPDAFEILIDRLLESPTYGQHWARHWLDVARYADTKGYVFTANPVYPYAYTYRDYVIEALNEDVPFDRFIIEQLAADLVEQRRNERTLAALGFLTVGRRFNNDFHDIIDDRIDVITRGFLGLTVACARCHDHKYDPIPTADYYSLYGVMASCEEPGELPLVGDPTEHPGYRRFQEELQRRRQAAEDYLSLQHSLLEADLRWRLGEYLQVVARQNGEQRVEKTPPYIKPRVLDQWQSFLKNPVRSKDPAFSVWAALSKIPAERFEHQARDELDQLAARAATGDSSSVNLLVTATLLCEQPKSLIEVADTFAHLFAASDSVWVAMGNPVLSAASVSEPVLETVREHLATAVTPSETSDELRSQTLHRVLADLQQLRRFLYSADAPVVVERDKVRRNLDVREKQRLERLFREADEFEATSPDAPPRAMVVVDKATPVEPHVFERGDPRRAGQPVPRQFLAALAEGRPEPFTKGSGRLELAEKIASDSNPLTARVIVNRVWQHHFGRGLVQTSSNFGAIGEPPSHPELLDWLAYEFMEHGWSLKWLHREIMRSSTYQQSSALCVSIVEGVEAEIGVACQSSAQPVLHSQSQTPHKLDPENRLLWRQRRYRLDFEPLRDALLAWSGRLDTSHGGQPFRLGEQPSIPRRTIYGLIDRQHLFEPLRYFDVASPDASADERPRTIVPQQALFLLNSPFIAEQARALVKRLSHGEPGDDALIVALYETILLREPAADELASARAFVSPSDATPTSEVDPSQLTRLEQLAQTLMITNEAVFVD